MNTEPPPLSPRPPKKPVALAVVLAIVPLAIVLLILTFDATLRHLRVYSVPAALVSIACCLVSSIILFRHKTPDAIVFGVLLLLLNGLISFGLGCAAIAPDLSFH